MAFKSYLKEADEARFNALNEYVFDLMFFSNQIHAWHLQTGSYAAHLAFADLYAAIPDLVDKIAEAIIGQNRKLVSPAKPYTFISDSMNNMDGMVAAIESFNQKATLLFKSTNDLAGVNNTLADLISLFDGVIYKLKNLK